MNTEPIETKVNAAKCPNCKSIIFSRSRHDFRTCPCGKVSVDGGLDYFKISFDGEMPETMVVCVPVTRQQLYDDWNHRKNKFGIINSE